MQRNVDAMVTITRAEEDAAGSSQAPATGGLNETPGDELDALIRAIPEGWSRTTIEGRSWAVTRTTRAGGKVITVDASLLGTPEQFGANVWLTTEGAILKPCEVPAEKVMTFLRAAATAAR